MRKNSAKRILSNNPYKLNRFGVLELPGLPAIPLAGLTASRSDQAARRRSRISRTITCG